MSRSNYTDDYAHLDLYRHAVDRAIQGKRGQSFLRELRDEMGKMPVKELIQEELIDADGRCCTIGVVCKARGINVETLPADSPVDVGKVVGIARSMAAEIAFENDDNEWMCYRQHSETPSARWVRMHRWVIENIK